MKMFFESETLNPNNESKVCNLRFHHHHHIYHTTIILLPLSHYLFLVMLVTHMKQLDHCKIILENFVVYKISERTELRLHVFSPSNIAH